MSIRKFGEFITESDEWSKHHTKDLSYFEDIFYNLLEIDYSIELDKYFGIATVGDKIEYSQNPKSGYKPAYTIKLKSNFSLNDLKITDLSKVIELINSIKSACKRLEADLGFCLIDINTYGTEINVIESEAKEVEIKNTDLHEFQEDVKRKMSRYHQGIVVSMTENGVDLDVSTLTTSQRATARKHLNKLKQEEWAHNFYNTPNREDQYQESYVFDITTTPNHIILDFKKRILRYPYRKEQ